MPSDDSGLGPTDGEQEERLRIALERQERALRALALRLRAAERKAAAMAERNRQHHDSIANRLGHALLDAGRSFAGLKGLPASLLAIRREDLRRRAASRPGSIAPARPAPPTEPSVRAQPAMLAPHPGGDKRWRVAAILDDFSAHAFEPECAFLPLTRDGWRTEIAAFAPDFVLVESAWRGKDGNWAGLVHGASQDLADLTAWCASQGIPTAFWNKEDPVHFSGFLPAARLFDHVFTTDFDSIPGYRAALGHDRVHLLPFGVQPLHFNPIEEVERSDRFFFAGSYYHKYPQRKLDFGVLADFAIATHGLDIFDRNIARAGKNFVYPEAYVPHVVGDLPFDAMPVLAKAYRAGLNLNTVKQSQSMVARRVFELMASNTFVVSNYARAVRQMFGDLVIASDHAAELHARWAGLTGDAATFGKVRLAGVRKIMAGHTCAHRLARIAAKLSNSQNQTIAAPPVVVVASASTPDARDGILRQFRRQTHESRHLLLVADNTPGSKALFDLAPNEEVIARDALAARLADAPWVSFWSERDHYGANFLTDLALATRYWRGDAVGKRARFVLDQGQPVLIEPDLQYIPVERLDLRCALVSGALASLAVSAGGRLSEARLPANARTLAIDPYNYCRDGAGAEPAQLASVDDLPNLWSGLALDAFEATTAPLSSGTPVVHIGPDALARYLPKGRSRALGVSIRPDAITLRSKVAQDAHSSIILSSPFPVSPQDVSAGLRVNAAITPVTAHHAVKVIYEFLDSSGDRIDHQTEDAGRAVLAPPSGTAAIRVGLRLQGRITVRWSALEFGGEALPARLLPVPMSRVLMVLRQYPSYGDRYRYAFAHARARAYREAGRKVDVFRFGSDAGAHHFDEFENVDVTCGGHDGLQDLLATGQYDHVLVHFLDRAIWQVVAPHLDRIKVTVWVHGAEIQPWERRAFDDDGAPAQRKLHRQRSSEARLGFWRGLLRDPHPNVRFVYVSRTLLEQSAEDLGLAISAPAAAVINNPIDTDFFDFQEKPVEQRSRILLLRPFASRIQGNDLAVAAILQLASSPGFANLAFTIAGDGPLFEETVAPLRHLTNITIRRGFVSRNEIKALHREHGVFLCPSRMDTQGVSRDEAMASGLVPVTNRVGAIPEFVRDDCGYLADPEDSDGLAAAIAELQANPEQFRALSRCAAEHVRSRSGFDRTVARELAMISKAR